MSLHPIRVHPAARKYFGALLLLAGLSSSCRRHPEPSGDLESREHGGTLGPRAEVVAQADRLSALAARQTSSDAVANLKLAAALRERLWRLDGKMVDGMEAADLWREAGIRGDCLSALRESALKFELGGELDASTAEFSRLADLERDPACSEIAHKILMLVDATRGQATSADDKVSELGRWNTPRRFEKGAAHVVSVTPYGSRDSARVVVALSEPASFRTGILKSEDAGSSRRLFVDLDRAVLDQPQSHQVGGLVERVRLAQRPDGVRIVLDLEDVAEHRVFYVPEPFRLIVDVARGSTMLRLSSRGPRVLERVVMDPGHGGYDPGAVGPRGLREKDVTLDIAHRAGPLIARELGVSTLLTRDTDAFVSLEERTARANAFGADLFISIHCNAAERTGSDGIMTFVLDRSSDAAASQMAALENAASDAAAKELATTLGQTQDEGLLTRSLHFAELLQRATAASLVPIYGPIQNHGVRRAGFYVLAGAHMPAVLFEVSFISNPNGEVRLNTGDYRQKLADALVNSVRAYRDGL